MYTTAVPATCKCSARSAFSDHGAGKTAGSGKPDSLLSIPGSIYVAILEARRELLSEGTCPAECCGSPKLKFDFQHIFDGPSQQLLAEQRILQRKQRPHACRALRGASIGFVQL